jgi:2-dehydro-3-deoxyphosphogluconate aldolase/(4S)-4-hydroxy-2-oxoglutarate aldolase
MSSITETAQRLEAGRLIAIVRTKGPADLPAIAEAIAKGGIRAIEFTLNTPGALPGVQRTVAKLGSTALIGAGTVLTADDARRAAEAGAVFLVSPICSKELVDAAHANGCAVLPGAYTPTEIHAADALGADLIKLFPAGGLGPAYVREVLAPLGGIRLVPTGGVTAANAGAFLSAGAAALAVGASVCNPEWVAAKDYGAIEHAARALHEAVSAWERGESA